MNFISFFLLCGPYFTSGFIRCFAGISVFSAFDYLTFSGIKYVGFFFELYIKVLMLLLLKLLLNYYKYLRLKIEVLKFDAKLLNFLRQIQYDAYILKTFVYLYNKIFGWVLLFLVFNAVTVILSTVATNFMIDNITKTTRFLSVVSAFCQYVRNSE